MRNRSAEDDNLPLACGMSLSASVGSLIQGLLSLTASIGKFPLSPISQAHVLEHWLQAPPLTAVMLGIAIGAIVLAMAAFLLPEVILGLRALTIADTVAAAVEGEFSAQELGVISEAKSILAAPEFAEISAANQAGEATSVNIGGRTILYEPELPASGMTMFGENGFIIGSEAFSSDLELNQTILHELYRLNFSGSAGGISGELASQETNAAASFAARAVGKLQ